MAEAAHGTPPLRGLRPRSSRPDDAARHGCRPTGIRRDRSCAPISVTARAAGCGETSSSTRRTSCLTPSRDVCGRCRQPRKSYESISVTDVGVRCYRCFTVVAHLLEPAGDAPAVLAPHGRERLQDHEIEARTTWAPRIFMNERTVRRFLRPSPTRRFLLLEALATWRREGGAIAGPGSGRSRCRS
jgi:hypothetical protein